MNRTLTAHSHAAPLTGRGALPVLGRVLSLVAREERAWLVGLPVLAAVVTALMAPSYSGIYTNEEDLSRAVTVAQGSEAQLFLYGPLSQQAGIPQIMFWELGSLTCLVLGVVIVLRAVACSRGEEDLDRADLLEATGARAVVRLSAQGLVLVGECLLLGAAAGAGVLRLQEADVAAAAAYAGTLALTLLLLASRRDLGLGALRMRAPWSTLRLRALGPGTVFATLVLGQCVTWALIIGAVTGMLMAMGEDLVAMVEQGVPNGEGSPGAFLDGPDPAVDYLRYVGALAGALAAGQAIVLAGRYGADERSGRLEEVIATGVRPWRAMLAWWLTATLGAAACLGLAALAAGVIGEACLATRPEDALRLVLGQWPAAVAAGGLSSAPSALATQTRDLAWAPVVVGFGITQLGAVLDLSHRVRDAAPFVKAGQLSSLWLLGLGLLGLTVGLAGVHRRDLRPLSAAP